MAALPANSDTVESVVDRGRRRIAALISRRERFLAVCFLLGGACGLLFFGADFFPLLLVLLVACLGVYLAWSRRRGSDPGAYAVAQLVDSRWGLEDQLATAYHFRAAGAAGPFAAIQYERARKAAAAVRLEAVFPDESPPTLRAAAALAGAGLLLLGVRAALQPQFSIQPPLPSVIMAALFGGDWNRPREAVIERSAAGREAQDEAAAAEDSFQVPPGEKAEAPPEAAPLPDEEFRPPPDDPQWKPEVEGLAANPQDDIESGEPLFENPLDDGGENAEAGEDAGAQDESETPAQDDWSEEAQSLLDKLKQAFDNMIETFDMASNQSGEPGGEEGKPAGEESAESGEPGEGESDMPGEQSANAAMEGGEPTEQTGEAGQAPGQGGEDSNEQPGGGETASAAGGNEGSKELAEAERMQVMGELEELFMERAENMTGEVTVETRFAEQSASVPFNNRAMRRSDRGGDVSRDEIPAEYRAYIQNYFELLRRNGN